MGTQGSQTATDPDIEALAASLTSGPDVHLRALFNAAGARPPVVLWSPRPEEMHHPALRHLADLCGGHADAQGKVPASAITPERLEAVADWLMLIDVEGDGGPYRYRHYGRRISDHFGRDMTGLTTSDFGGHISLFFSALYTAAARSGAWVLSEHEPPRDVFVRAWQRLIVPLVDDAGRVIRFAAVNIPENELRAGLELMVDPVFVLDAAQGIQYSNQAARRFFGVTSPRPAPATLKDVTGIAVPPGLDPAQLMTTGESVDSIELALNGVIVERLVMTVSATQNRGQGYFVVVMRLIGT